MLDSSIHRAKAPSFVTFTFGERKFFRKAQSRVVAAATPLFAEGLKKGDTSRVVEGAVCLCRQTADGGRHVLDVLGPGHLVGPFLTDIDCCNVVALTRTRLASLGASEEADEVAEATRRMLTRAQSHAILLRRSGVWERVASCLLDLADQFGAACEGDPDDETTFTLHLNRSDLADWLGLTLASVSRGLNDFKRAGLIAFDHPKVITIRDRAGLEALAFGPCEPAGKSQPHGAQRSGAS